MTEILLSNQTYVLGFGLTNEQLEAIQIISRNMGFHCITKASAEEFMRCVEKISNPAGILVIENEELGKRILGLGRKPLLLKKDTSSSELLKELDGYLLAPLPDNLLKLIEATVSRVVTQLFGTEIEFEKKGVKPSVVFPNWAICDSVAEGLVMKATCEFEPDKMRKFYPKLGTKIDKQFMDASGELCNQLLGAIGSSLRKIGLKPLISLPIRIQMSEGLKINELSYTHFIRHIDKHEAIAAGILVQVDPSISINWKNLSPNPVEEEIDFF